MRRLASFLAALALATPSWAVSPNQYEILLVNPKANQYTPPARTNPYVISLGASDVGNAIGSSFTASQVQISDYISNNYSTFSLLSNPALAHEPSYNYGVNATTSAHHRAVVSAASAYCNDTSASTSASCYTSTRLSTNATASNGSSVLCFASITGIVTGMYALNGNLYPGTTVTALTGSGCAGSIGVTLSRANASSISSGTNITFAPAAQTSAYYNYTGGGTYQDFGPDSDTSPLSNGKYSPCSDPAPVVMFAPGGNDAQNLQAPLLQVFQNHAAILDAFGPKGCNKVVYTGGMTPRGLGTQLNEYVTVPANPYQVTSAQGALWYDDQGVYYAPSASGYAPGTNDGTALINDGACGTASAAGHFCTTAATGTYTFNAADTGKTLILFYRYTGFTTSLTRLRSVHNWYNATSCSSFYDAETTTTFPISGAQCNRPWVHVAKAWEALVDGSTGANQYPLPFVSTDGTHLLPYGQAIATKLMATQALSYTGSTPAFPLPTINNVSFSGTGSTSTSAQSPTTCAVSNNTKDHYLTALSPAASTGVYSTGMVIYSSTSTNLPSGQTVDCVDTTNNQLHMTAASLANATFTTTLGQADTASMIYNGLMDHRQFSTPTVSSCNSHCGTPSFKSGAGSFGGGCVSSCTTISQGVPTGWTFSTTSQNTTALNAGTMFLNYGVETNPLGDGYDDFAISVGGIMGATSSTFTFLQTPSVLLDTNLLSVPAASKFRGVCQISIDKGPNGHLWGLQSASIQIQSTTGNAFTPISANTGTVPTTTKSVSGIGYGATKQGFSDKDVISGPWTYTLVTPWMDTTPYSSSPPISTSNITVTFQTEISSAASFSARVRQCSLERVTQ